MFINSNAVGVHALACFVHSTPKRKLQRKQPLGTKRLQEPQSKLSIVLTIDIAIVVEIELRIETRIINRF